MRPALRSLLVPVVVLAVGASVSPGGSLAAAVHTGVARWQVVASPQTLPGLKAPASIAIDGRGSGGPKWMYVTDTVSGRLYKAGTGGRYLGRWLVTRPGNPSSSFAAVVAVGGRGNVFVTDPGRNTVLKLSPSGQRLARWTADAGTGALNTPRGIAVDRLGIVYVADMGNRRIVRFEPNGTASLSWPMLWTGAAGSAIPEPLAIDRSGTLLAGGACYQESCTAGHGDVQHILVAYTGHGAYLNGWPGATPHGGQGPGEEPFVMITGIAADWQGNRYVAGLIESAPNTPAPGVIQYSAAMKVVGRWTLPGNGLPGGIAVGPGRSVYVTYGKQVLRLLR